MIQNKIILTGITATGKLTLGNYLGAIKPLLKLQEENKLFIFAANLHSITQMTGENPLIIPKKELLNNTYRIIALYIACGLNYEKNCLFIQSQIPAHSEMQYLLTCCTTIGQLNRMTQFKDKSSKNNKIISIPTGLLIYPCLMAGDILLYNADYIPIGVDQKQHIELTRDIAIFFNKKFGKTFKIPEPLIPKITAKIKNLKDPTKKMSKSSDNKLTYISLFDTKEDVIEKIKQAKTDFENKIYFNEKTKPGISNLLSIYSGLTNISISEIEKKYENKNYEIFKKDVADIINVNLEIIQNKFQKYSDHKIIDKILQKHYDEITKISNSVLQKAKKNIGLP